MKKRRIEVVFLMLVGFAFSVLCLPISASAAGKISVAVTDTSGNALGNIYVEACTTAACSSAGKVSGNTDLEGLVTLTVPAGSRVLRLSDSNARGLVTPIFYQDNNATPTPVVVKDGNETPVAQVMFDKPLVADFPGFGLYFYDPIRGIVTADFKDDGWAQISPANGTKNTVFNDKNDNATLVSSFTGYGTFATHSLVKWLPNSGAAAEQILWNNKVKKLYADFGGFGLYSTPNPLRDDNWTQLSAANPDFMLFADAATSDRLYVDFASLGLWTHFDGDGNWTELSPANPAAKMIFNISTQIPAWQNSLFVNFGSLGNWQFETAEVDGVKYYEGVWSQIGVYPEALVPGPDGYMYGDFGTYGIWRTADPHARLWTQFHKANPDKMQFFGNNLVVDFGGLGLWSYASDFKNWYQLSAANPDGFYKQADNALIVDFGGLGLWKFNGFDVVWTELSPANPDEVVVVPDTVKFPSLK